MLCEMGNLMSKGRTKTPRAIDVPSDKVVRTLNVVGNRTETKNEPKIAPRSCEQMRRIPLTMPTPLTMIMPRVTAGLKLSHVRMCACTGGRLINTYSPPEIRKKIHTLTIKLKPNEREMYINTIGLKPVFAFVVD